MKKASIQQWVLGLRLNSTKEQERHNVTVITVGSRYYSLCSVSSSLSHATLEQPFRTLVIKWEVYIIVKEVFLHLPSCVVYYCVCLCHFMRLLSLRRYVSSIYMYISAWTTDDYITISLFRLTPVFTLFDRVSFKDWYLSSTNNYSLQQHGFSIIHFCF